MASLLPIGRDAATGGYHRFAWQPAELECRAWFVEQARSRGLAVERDRNGNLSAWWRPEREQPRDQGRGSRGPLRDQGGGEGAVVTGSHLDSVPGGGAFDGPLGVVSALAAIDRLRERGRTPSRPIGVAVFAEEEEIGKVSVTPGGVNAIPSLVTAWLDARGPTEEAVLATVEQIGWAAETATDAHKVTAVMTRESETEIASFDRPFRDRLVGAVARAGTDVPAGFTPGSVSGSESGPGGPRPPVLPTGAGHDAGILSSHVTTGMLFVRNPTGISHAPAEHAELADCLAGVDALAAVLEDLACDPPRTG